jgi:NAD(P)H-hydrate epimerase
VKPVITPAESARLDLAAADPVDVLMERAGLAVALAAVREGAGYGTRVLALAGPGNNGGDAYVAARYLRRRGIDAEVRCLTYPRGDDSPARAAACAAVDAGVPVEPLGEPEPCDLLIDGLFGAGFRGVLSDPAAAWTAHPAPVIAVDLPSGLNGADGTSGGAVFTAVRTVTFHALKVGHLIGEGPDRCGEVEVADIGLDGGQPVLRVCEESDAPVPARARTAHKWSAGSVLVVGGSPGIGGAAMLTARSALEFGAGAVRIACPAALQPQLAPMDAGVMTAGVGSGDRFVGDDAPAVLEAASRFDVIALGPGLGTGGGTAGFVAAVADGWERPLVIDADGLNALTIGVLSRRPSATVVTPHAGEFGRLTGDEAGWEAAARLAAETGAVVLLKGNPTFVAGGETWVVANGGPELATIGTGDVLTGMIAALVARGQDAETAARSAAFRHAAAAAELADWTTVTATSLATTIGEWAT